MAKLKRKNCRNKMHHKRDIFPRRAKEQTLVNLENLAVIMQVIEESCSAEDETIKKEPKNQRRNVKKCKKEGRILKTDYKKSFKDQKSRCRSSVVEVDVGLEDSTRVLNGKNYKSKSPVLLPNTGGLSHFMELGARTDLLCDSLMADPLGPDNYDNFQWVEVKQELSDDIEVCKIKFTEFPVKFDDVEATDFQTDDVKETNYIKRVDDKETCTSSDLMPTLEPVVLYNRTKDFSSSVQDEAAVADTGSCVDKEEVSEISPDGRSLTNESFTERLKTENAEKNPPKKKKKYYPQQCDICDKKLYSKGNLRHHKLKKHKLKVQFTCELCSLKFDLHREVVQHRNSVHRGEDGRFGCDVCSKRVLDYYSYLVHVKSHIDSCKEEEGSDKVGSDCNESLKITQTSVCSVNLRGKLKSQEKNLICDTCGKRFAFSCLLRDHINTHTGVKPYLCQKCGKAFCQKSTLKQHTRTHSEVRPFKCSECPQGFYSKGDYVKHQRKHTGERPYVCEACGEGFSRSTHLVIHRRTHTGERPHICDICDRGFTKRGDVVRHRRVHTGELPYLCQVCGKAFRQSSQCANHIRSQHPDSPAPVARNPNPLTHGVQVQLSC